MGENININININTTVVSAYYEMKSKYTTDCYKKWISFFLESCPCHLVFFTEAPLVEFIATCRQKYKDRTFIVVCPRELWRTNTEYPQSFWEDQWNKDRHQELHNAELYKVWNEKKNFVMGAIQLNPFKHEKFIWTDAGIARSPGSARIMSGFPFAANIPNNSILALCVYPFTNNEVEETHMAAGVIAGTISAWISFYKIYDEIFSRCIQKNQFVGKEEYILNRIYIDYPGLITCIHPPPSTINKWRYLLRYFSKIDKP